MTMPRLHLQGIRKAFAAPVLRGIDLSLAPGEVHALVGANGAGKSTLSRIIAGLERADAGALLLDGEAYAPRSKREAAQRGVAMVLQELSSIDPLTVAENLLLTHLPRRWGVVDRRRLHGEARRLLGLVGLGDLAPETPMERLGVGQKQLVEIAAAFARPCRLLILDEPTAALTPHDAERLFVQMRRLRAEGTTIIYISHRLDELRAIADRVSVLRDGVLVETRPAAGFPADEMVAAMVGSRPGEEEVSARRPTPGAVALRVDRLRAGSAVRDVSFELRAGEILGISGLVGAGRTETLRALFGADARDGGAIYLGGATTPTALRSPREAVAHGLAFVTEDRRREGLLLPLPVRVNTTIANLRTLATGGHLLRGADEARTVDGWIRRLAVRCTGAEQPVAELSGGNQQKVCIARWLFRGSQVLLLDEPTRGVDAGARKEIYRLLASLAAEGKALLVVSSDLEELMRICDRIAVMSKGVIVTTLDRAHFSEAALTAAAFAGHRTASVEVTA